MIKTINKAAVIGAGVMGSSIAALLAGCGIQVRLLDIVPPELSEKDAARGITQDSPAFRNAFAQAAKDKMQNPRTGMLFDVGQAANISVGNLSDNIDSIAHCDWIIEVVAENLAIKKEIMPKICSHRKAGSIVSTNTSGISITKICEDMPEEFRQHFLGTHFFNPPRYMKLFEVIPSKDTLPEVTQFISDFAKTRLGKGIVSAKDTPNFIGNRIGVFATLNTINTMQKHGLDIAAIDQITGPVLGRPKSATFGTADMVGLDVFAAVAQNLVNSPIDEAEKAAFTMPEFVEGLIAAGALGNKTKKGFYQKALVEGEKVTQQWDYLCGEYQTFSRPVSDAVKSALASENKYAAMVYGNQTENTFAWEHIKSILLYSASKIPEITDDYTMIDKAMVWGYNWEKGPFALWDEIGLSRSVERMQAEGETVPRWVLDKLNSGNERFYQDELNKHVNILGGTTPLAKIAGNNKASLWDIGEDVLCLEFHSKGNAISAETVEVINKAVDILEDGSWRGMVLGNKGKNYSAGADLAVMSKFIEDKNWAGLSEMIEAGQRAFGRIKYASAPVVSAPFGMVLGGGLETVLHTARVVAYQESTMGLVEAGVGLVPGAGGCKELLARMGDTNKKAKYEMLPQLKAIWQRIATAATTASASNALAVGILRAGDKIIMDQDSLIATAKSLVLELSEEGYAIPAKRELTVLGHYGMASILYDLEAMRDGGFVSQYDAHIAKKIAYILTGGDVAALTKVSEEYILELEREAFLSLAGEEKTQQRIVHMLAKGRPLRN